ncbi:nucleotidyltransferase domain-containing protein [Romeria aff. gracilis LEGE 07310]|uniref:Nucleotidyltransferase domain-containing protein n=1 Tax=Vasconcelosia minhoensis LEGE 07310 TaxID=915328 RepID=A0A8J7AJX5_9CYAN|nr:nucleotidyltransferase domain-containing protein [Romeria gracilis]MBE9078958.1 nucleotidyltransferase domain-containing protein [Romeria aff. gracilis LEGE 07310]
MQIIADLPLKENDRLAIEAAVDLLLNQFPVEQVILYGSKVSGQDTEESDIDLLVLTRRPLTWQERNTITDTLFDQELVYDVVISTLIVTRTEWMTGPYSLLPIHDEIDRHGVAA